MPSFVEKQIIEEIIHRQKLQQRQAQVRLSQSEPLIVFTFGLSIYESIAYNFASEGDLYTWNE